MAGPRTDRPTSRERLRRGAYLLPSVFTILNIFFGFYAVVRGLHGDFHPAAYLIMVAGVLDTLDGRIARSMGTDSPFGREYDSLADVMSFGFAPALLGYLWGLDRIGDVGWLVPLFFVVCTATRLARFNIQTEVADKRYFVGMPCPAAAASICSLFLVLPDPESGILDPHQRWLVLGAMLAALIGLGSLMVSTFRYPSLKQVDLRKKWSYRTLLIPAILILVLAWWPTAFFFAVAVIYTSTGVLSWLVSRFRRPTPPESDPDSATAEKGVSEGRPATAELP